MTDVISFESDFSMVKSRLTSDKFFSIYTTSEEVPTIFS